MDPNTNQPITLVEDYVRYANRRPGRTIPADYYDAARSAAMRRHPSSGLHLTAADGTPDAPLPTDHPTDN